MNPYCVLLVEDNRMVRELYMKLFSWAHIRVQSAVTLEEAHIKLEELADMKIVVLTNYHLSPNISDSLIIRAVELKIPTLGMTTDEIIARHMLTLGCVDAFLKPCNIDTITKAIRAM